MLLVLIVGLYILSELCESVSIGLDQLNELKSDPKLLIVSFDGFWARLLASQCYTKPKFDWQKWSFSQIYASSFSFKIFC